MPRTVVVPLIALALLSVAGYHVAHNSQRKPALAAPAAPARTPWGESIAGTGIVEPWTENVAIGTHVAGIVQEVLVEVGQEVNKGTPLFRIDERQLRAELALREALLASAQVQLDRLEQQPRPEELPGSAAAVREAQARLEEELDRFRRSEELIGKNGPLVGRKLISDEDFAVRRQNLAVAKEQLEKAKADDALLRAGAWGPDKLVSRAAVEQARAQVEQTRTDLARLTVTAPIDGQVLQVDVRPGEFVAHATSTDLMVLGNLRPLHVRVDIDEAEIPRLRPGSTARGFVRGQTDQPIALDFKRVEPYVIPKKSLTGGNTERVDTRVLQVIFAVRASGETTLYVGQQMDVFIETSRHGYDSQTQDMPAMAGK